ncbi:hypothetical protein BDP27DRAFT_1356808 [Rhodocollybia butyracea]|uniref:Uncharacterized protein n=1 Tax=Rhodocollybia butyracea TaxID=206335 RepID=A0A9P5QB75_9AGAR|nr:hypothetical protein BDP27DRAFT_1356808 [Rhodocollybia butyracea]
MSSHAKTKGNHTKQHGPSTQASAKQQQHHATQTPSSLGTSAGQKHKRNEGNSTEQDATSSEQPGDDAAAKKPEPYTGQKVYAIKKNTFEDPNGSLSRLKCAVELVIHLLSGAYNRTEVLELPTAQCVANIEQVYAGSTLLRSLIDDILPRAPVKSSQVQQKLREVRIACTGKSRSMIARNISLIPDDHIIFAFGLLKEFGLFVWKPDILGGSPTSTYNFVHETAFLKIFGQLILTRSLDHMGVLPKYANNSALQQRFYQNYLFVTCKNQAKREAKGKEKLRDKRLEVQQTRGWSIRIQSIMSELACHSDDEDNTTKDSFLIHKMPRCSSKGTTWMRSTDEFITFCQSHCFSIPHVENSQNHSHPPKGYPKVALDWHDPIFFNSLLAHIRAKYINAPIALPLEERLDEPGWQKMKDDEFMVKYGNEVRSYGAGGWDAPEDEEGGKGFDANPESDMEGEYEDGGDLGDNDFEMGSTDTTSEGKDVEPMEQDEGEPTDDDARDAADAAAAAADL